MYSKACLWWFRTRSLSWTWPWPTGSLAHQAAVPVVLVRASRPQSHSSTAQSRETSSRSGTSSGAAQRERRPPRRGRRSGGGGGGGSRGSWGSEENRFFLPLPPPARGAHLHGSMSPPGLAGRVWRVWGGLEGLEGLKGSGGFGGLRRTRFRTQFLQSGSGGSDNEPSRRGALQQLSVCACVRVSAVCVCLSSTTYVTSGVYIQAIRYAFTVT